MVIANITQIFSSMSSYRHEMISHYTALKNIWITESKHTYDSLSTRHDLLKRCVIWTQHLLDVLTFLHLPIQKICVQIYPAWPSPLLEPEKHKHAWNEQEWELKKAVNLAIFDTCNHQFVGTIDMARIDLSITLLTQYRLLSVVNTHIKASKYLN